MIYFSQNKICCDCYVCFFTNNKGHTNLVGKNSGTMRDFVHQDFLYHFLSRIFLGIRFFTQNCKSIKTYLDLTMNVTQPMKCMLV